MRYLVLVLVGCVSSSDPNVTEDPLESEASLAVTAHRAEPVEDLVVTRSSIPTCPTGTWCIEAPPTVGTPRLHAVSAVSSSDVFAVGDAGTIIRRTGGSWVTMTSGTSANLRGVWVLSSSDVWACGVGGVILHFDGTSWSSVSSGFTTDNDACWASSSTDVWFTGGAIALRYDGSTFTKYTFAGTMLAVSGTGPNDVYVTGENTNVHRWNGSAWTTLTPGTGTTSYLTVLAVPSSGAWVSDVMPSKQTVFWSGSSWTNKAVSAYFNSMSDVGTSDIWGVGNSGKVAHWNGTAWSTPTTPLGTANLWSVTTPPGDVFVVGDSATIGHMPL